MEFAETLEISLRAYKGYELGSREIPTLVVLRICDFSSVTPSWLLLGRKDEVEPASMEVVKETLVQGLELLRSHSANVRSENWAEFLAVLVSMSHAENAPVTKDVASSIFSLKDKL